MTTSQHPPLRLACLAFALGCSAICAVVSGCASGTYRAGEDNSQAYSFRIVAETSPGRTRGGPGGLGLGEEVSAGYLHTLEGEISNTWGDDSGSFDRVVEIGGANFPAGTSLQSDFSLTAASVLSSSGYRTETGLEFSFLYGLELTALDLELRGGGLSGDNDHQELGALLGLRLRWLIDERFRIFASHRLSALQYSLEQSELGVEYRVVPRLSLFGGFRRSEYNLDHTTDSKIDLTWKGLLLGIQLEF